MYCIHCGVKLADTEKKCPLCETAVYHPDIKQNDVRPTYPKGKYPKAKANSKVFNGIFIILFLIPLFICFMADLQRDGVINWFGYAAGGLLLGYVAFALPKWFKKPNPVIFVPCDFAAALLFLLYVNFETGGNWFLTYAFPITGAVALIVCAMVTLLYYLKRVRLYIWGGGLIAFGALMPLIEFLLKVTFNVRFIGWSIYPLIVLALLGGALIYLAIDASAREMMERKLFF